jgi:glycosyltransferase involved in cell wall biosynthesis
MKGLVIIPAFNEEGAILNTVKNIQEKAPSFDYVVINDCSTDHTEKILKEYSINHINLPINSGIGGAVQTGYIYAERMGYDCAVQMDGDGQHDAAFLEEMIKHLRTDKADMIIGSRFIKNEGFQSSVMRRTGIRFFTWWIHLLTGRIITDPTSGMRLVNRKIIELFAREYPRDYPEPETVVTILKKGFRVEEIPVQMLARQSGKSSISMNKSVYYMFKVSIACWIAALSSNKRQ